MITPSITPTLADLRSALDRAERDLVCADMIDNFQRREIEVAEARRRRDAIKTQIAIFDDAEGRN
ncbi:MAG: hypothetical protein E5Y10_22030 [Mesorhizobium sp.]|uniref:hypothetical protein n=1 Tax=Mesorhizobium sp. TaxID=1871066 RepID=UPI00120D0E48|nr:hypothetical protein [Mesorhizobium sp.]TIN36812.1 MAG: hypothetical protein E5Y13_22640 [Mesorhizobium sp.]TJU86657.1 MAG: hypothetical protein E5Y10_22030 [Mesorhizobium sp.]